jgi:DNA-binding transcriptional MocR family regulator
LDEIGVSYIFIEDTGKTWPTHDIKISILAMSKNLREPLYDIYTDFILHVSPFATKLLSEFLKNSISDNLEKVQSVINKNYQLLKTATENTILIPVQKPFSSVAWAEINNELSAIALKEILDRNGIFVLPGNYFFWSDRNKGDKFIRIALTREHDKFKRAMEKLREVLEEIG